MLKYDWVMSNQPEWTEYEGFPALRVNDSKYFALPINGTRKCYTYEVRNSVTREPVCQLRENEVRGWLVRAHWHQEVNP